MTLVGNGSLTVSGSRNVPSGTLISTLTGSRPAFSILNRYRPRGTNTHRAFPALTVPTGWPSAMIVAPTQDPSCGRSSRSRHSVPEQRSSFGRVAMPVRPKWSASSIVRIFPSSNRDSCWTCPKATIGQALGRVAANPPFSLVSLDQGPSLVNRETAPQFPIKGIALRPSTGTRYG